MAEIRHQPVGDLSLLGDRAWTWLLTGPVVQ